ncbi:TraG family conjugative transposon ATPase [Pedobacter frigidisoli]|uniref:TraG family conjugative transposon ATPase n=1 Tax=Pedobacter frigidisoli TaxID=2530455 RepID=A0A4R0NZ02_9SPHI|nr:TraG family conjugative transposon ATPase [Pedobacter frigidisoli]TCD07689.1 TraG family conjugative transposon ATPase [Pedobacter frigidisoli]
MKKNKTFELPYIGIAPREGMDFLYGERGDYSIVIRMENPALRYCADPSAYTGFHHLLLNIIKILGEGHIIQKQDILARKRYQAPYHSEYLQQSYNDHFQGRAFLQVQTFLILTRVIKKGAFYVYDAKAELDFSQRVIKVVELLKQASLSPQVLTASQIESHTKRILSMDFSKKGIAMENIRPHDTHLSIGDRAIRSISLVDIDSIDLPSSLATFQSRHDGKAFRGFAMDNLSFLYDVPHVDCMVYNQVLEIPHQSITLSKLSLKRKRHAGIPDPANQMCMEDIDLLLSEVARENQLLVNAHYNILLSADQASLSTASGFIESSLFQIGIIASRNAYNQLELFRSALPGNGVSLKSYDWFLLSCEAAICLMFKERNQLDEQSDFLIRFTDRQGIPIGIDPSDLPMRSGRISNRSKFVLGGSGSGKSFFMNALIEQYLLYNMDVVIVDTGHSYSGLCAYLGGTYLTYSEQAPITMNPFLISQEEYNIEKRDFLKTLISLLLKGVDGEISQVEDTVISNVISAYYATHFLEQSACDPLGFDGFYHFSIGAIAQIKRSEQVSFDLDEYRYVLRKFCRGEEFGTLLNQSAAASLFTQRLIIFEIDAIREHKVLFPIVTLIIMDVFLQKMRHRATQRKALILEEAWKAIASPLMAGYLVYMYKTVRKFWGEAIVVTQELGDIIGNAVVKDSIISNSDTICLLDQGKFKENYGQVASLLSLTEVEQHKIFTINQLDKGQHRSRFKEVYIRRGLIGEVYGVEVSLRQYLTFSTEKPEKRALEHYIARFKDYRKGLDSFIEDLFSSGDTLEDFITKVNKTIN